MVIQIKDPDLERRLQLLGRRQPIPVKKTTMAEAILREAVSDERGEPVHKWREKSRRFVRAVGPTKPAA